MRYILGMSLTPVLTDAESRRTQIRTKALEALQNAFPLPLRDKKIEVSDLKVHEKDFGPNDQKHALLSGGSLFEQVKGTVTLRDAAGKEVEKVKNFTLLNLPFFTGRHTFILDGNEYNVSNQLRLKPGVYTRRRGNEELEAAFNLSKGSNFRLSMDPAHGHPYIEYGTTAIPLYSVLRKLGVPHTDIAAHWGTDVAGQNDAAFAGKHDKHFTKLYEKLVHPSKRLAATTPEGQLDAVRAAYAATAMDPDVTKKTLGHAFASVTPQALLVASKRLLNVYKNNDETDDRDALEFKTYHSVDDFIKERIGLDARTLANKVKGRATHKTELRDILPSSPFSAGIRSFLTGSQLSAIPTHINPMEAIDHAVRVTSLGEGGIANERAIPAEARTIHSSHLGILDPIRTSESFRAGIDIRTAMMAHRDTAGNLYTAARNVKTGKHEQLSAAQMADAVVAFPKQKMSGMVAAMDKGEVAHVPAAKVTHELYDASQLYSPATNLVPFLESVQGNRGIMGGKVQTQALPLIHREVPWVQSGIVQDGVAHSSWEKALASMSLPTAPVAGRVVRIDGQYIYIDPSGKKHAEDFSFSLEKTSFEKRGGAVKRQKTVDGLCMKIELEVGDERTGTNAEGKKWSKTMSVAYGHIPKTVGDDGETVDIYLKEDGVFENVYVVHQRKKDGSHDEDKCMVGFGSKDAAKESYEKHGPPWGYGSLTEYTWDEFKDDYLSERAREKAAAEKDLVRVPYDTHFPFASKTHLHHDLLVKPGDHVEAEQHLAESNFTRNGTFALGRNMSVGYVPYYGMNSNDAVVISSGAAEKMTSEHMYKEILDVERDAVVGRDIHQQYYGIKYTTDQYRKLDAHGVVKKGMKVLPHDILIAGVTKGKLSASDALLGNLKKTLVHPYRELVRTWDHDFEGEVMDVYATDTRVVVTVRTQEPMRVGDKITGRHGNKGVVSLIVPDHKMLQDEAGKPLEVLYTSAGVISRINPAQILETCVAKVAKKTGKPIAVENFSGRDNVQWAKNLLKEHNVKDKETLFDPVSGKKIPGILVGPQYVLRLFKTTETNYAARGTGAYDVNQQPIKGGDEGAKAVGKMEFNALVAHNARNVLKETATIKSQKNDEFWRAIQLGLPLPPLKSSFAYDKFVGMLHGAGVKVDTRGSISTLSPLTDRDIMKMSGGAVQNEKMVRAKDLAPERGGLFDPAVTGGTTGTRWSHIELAEPVVNPVFADPARRLLGMTAKEFDQFHYTQGGAALKKRLNAIDVQGRMSELRADIKKLNGTKLDDAVKQLKFLAALHRQELKVGDAYVLSKLPVLPPLMRPILPGKSGSELVVGDSNYLYQSALLHNQSLRRQVESPVLPPDEHAQLRKNLFNAVGAVVGTHEADNPKLLKRNVKGLLEHLTGKTTPKSSFFQKKIMKRQQDMSGRGTIAPDGSLGMDEVGIPIDMLWTMYGKFVIARLVRRGFGAVQAKEMLEKKHPAAHDALMAEIKERPVMVNRAPTLHRYGFIGAHPVPVAGKTITVNPFIELGMNADFDGNCYIGSTKVTLTLEDFADSLLRHPSSEIESMKFGPSVKVLLQDAAATLAEVELQDVPHEPVAYATDKNGAKSYAVPVGIQVWSYDHVRGEPVMAPVTSLTIEEGCAVAEVKTRSGFEVTASTNESLCVYDHETEQIRDICPAEAVGRLSPILLRTPVTGSLGDFELGWTVGAFVSDGFFMGERQHYYGYTKVSDTHRDRFAAGVTLVEGRQLKRTTYREEHGEDASVKGSSVKDHYYGAEKTVELFRKCYIEERLEGRASLSKTLPDFSGWSLEARWGLIVGLLDGDGCLTVSTGKAKKQVMANVATSAPGLVSALQLLLATVGVRSSVTESPPKAGRLQTHMAYVVTLSTVDLQKNVAWLRRGIFEGQKTQEALSLLETVPLRDVRDIVPVPHRLMELGAAVRGPCATDAALQGSLASSKYTRKAGPYVTRGVAQRMLACFATAETPNIETWARVVNATDVTWDIVEEVTPKGTATVYDLIVPSTQVFAVDGGLVVWDTFQIHVPVLKPAVDEVKAMTLSQLLFSDREKDSLMVAPRMEAMLGVHLASKAESSVNGKTHYFKNRADALAAYKRGDITLNTKVEVAP